MKISAVIPTRNRPHSLRRVLLSLIAQTRPADQIVVVDASDASREIDVLRQDFAMRNIRWIHTAGHVCRQRNIGISKAVGDWIFLCDDDVELPPDYLASLATYAANHPTCGVVAGRLLQCENGVWVDRYSVHSFRSLIWRFVFQLSVWGNIDGLKVPRVLRPAYRAIRSFYRRRNNDLSLAGWPLITEWSEPAFKTTVYALGASLIKKEWLHDAAYDETLDPSGIGDNYGVAMAFPSARSIHVLDYPNVLHHRAPENRLSAPLIYYRRIMALHYFMVRHRHGMMRQIWFLWSLVGNAVMFFAKGKRPMLRATAVAIWNVISFSNPYCRGRDKRSAAVSRQGSCLNETMM